MTSRTYVHETVDGRLVEYRRGEYGPRVFQMEARVLREDGTPYDDQWWKVSDANMLALQVNGSDIVDLLIGRSQ